MSRADVASSSRSILGFLSRKLWKTEPFFVSTLIVFFCLFYKFIYARAIKKKNKVEKRAKSKQKMGNNIFIKSKNEMSVSEVLFPDECPGNCHPLLLPAGELKEDTN